MGGKQGLVIHGSEVLDEMTDGETTSIWEMKSGRVTEGSISPEDLGLRRASIQEIRVSSVEESVGMLKGVLDGKLGPARDIVLMNAAAALVAADVAPTLKDGVALATDAIDSGRAREKVEAWVRLSQKLA